MLYGKRLAVPLKAVWKTELAKAYAETVHGTTRGYYRYIYSKSRPKVGICGPK